MLKELQQCIMQKYMQLKIFLFQRRNFPIHQLYMSEHAAQRFPRSFRALCFHSFSYFSYWILHGSQSTRQGRVDFKHSCPIEQHITALAALPLKHPARSMLSDTQSISH